jgi:hypothetical protein
MSSNDDFGIGPSLPQSSHTQILSEGIRAARLLEAHEQAVKLFDIVTEPDILRPGVRDSAATLAIRELAAERFGVSRHWHKRIVRSGPNTLLPYTSVNSGPMRRTDSSGRVGHWILEVHLIDRAREIGGFYEELLTIPTDVAAFPSQKGTK